MAAREYGAQRLFSTQRVLFWWPRNLTENRLSLFRVALYIHPMTSDENGGSFGARRKRLLFRAQRRGFKEVDLIFGTFAAEELATMPEAELDQFEALLIAQDQEVYAWLRGHAEPPPAFDTPVFARLKAVCNRKDPKWNV
jgi:antitoxin CptB